MGSAIERWGAAALGAALLGACPGPGSSQACQDLCAMLIFDCAFAAYPDPGSCEQGCLYDVAEGGDVHSLSACVAEAECDTAEVLACSRAYGGAP